MNHVIPGDPSRVRPSISPRTARFCHVHHVEIPKHQGMQKCKYRGTCITVILFTRYVVLVAMTVRCPGCWPKPSLPSHTHPSPSPPSKSDQNTTSERHVTPAPHVTTPSLTCLAAPESEPRIRPSPSPSGPITRPRAGSSYIAARWLAASTHG